MRKTHTSRYINTRRIRQKRWILYRMQGDKIRCMKYSFESEMINGLIKGKRLTGIYIVDKKRYMETDRNRQKTR